MFERFTDSARRCVVFAQEESRLLDHDYIGTEHLLLGLTRDRENIAADALVAFGVTISDVRAQVEIVVGRGTDQSAGHIPFTPRSKKALELSLREAQKLGDEHIGAEHILMGIIREGKGVAVRVLRELGVDLARLREQILELRAQPRRPVSVPFTARPGPGVIAAASGPPPLACALCGRDLWDVERHVLGGTATICSDCVRDAQAALDASTEREARMPPRAYGEPPPSSDELRAIQDAFSAGFGGDPAAIEDGVALAPYMERNRESHPGMQAEFVVQRVRLAAPDRADVRFVIVVRPMGFHIALEGAAIRSGDRWCVARETAVAVLRQGGVEPPPG